ncbi:MAG: RNA polymerase sigma factor [Candidatus Thiodiazotropha sp. (ex Epidulcina cf. delphinae)]|nr:RNA polymerase sigma factor [Candidatus Thiodiazotropha sp. (ex Epidulcina cf. delphinae)]
MNDHSLPDIYDKFAGAIQRYLGNFVGDATAEELTQEVFLKAQKGLVTFQERSSIKTWLYRIATNVLKDHLKSKHHRYDQQSITLSELESDGASPKENPLDQTSIRDEMRTCIVEFIHRLPESYSTVLVLSELEGYKIKEIAEILDDSPDTVKVRLHRARMRLRKALEQGCTFSYDEENELSCEKRGPITL